MYDRGGVLLNRKGIIPVFVVILMILTILISIGYSALNKNLSISGEAFLRSKGNVRISRIEMSNAENAGYETYNPEYSKRGTKVFSTLPNIDSKINYTVQMNNTTGVKYKFDSVTVSNTNPNIECIPSVEVGTIIEVGVSSFTIEVKYKDGITMDEKTDICEIKYEFSAYDVTPPTIKIETITDGETSKTVKITVLDDEEGSGLSEENNYKYYLSTSNIELTGGEWKDYTNKEEFTIEGKNQTKYLWVYPVQDKAGNISDDKTGITESYLLQEYNFISTYTVSYIGNKFSTTAKVQNGVTVTYDPNTSILTLNGNPTNDIVNLMLLNQTFNENDQFKITLDYISGTFTSSGEFTFSGDVVIATDIKNSSNENVSTRNWADIFLPTAAISNPSGILTTTSIGANEGSYLSVMLWMKSPSTTTFTNYKVKVNITKVDTKRVKYNEPYGILGDTPTREGYTFDGWYTEEIGGTKVTSDTVVSAEGDHTLYAHWKTATYTLTINPNGGVLNGTTNNSVYNIASGSTTNILNPTRTGYIFAGWTLSGAGSSMSGTTFTMGYENATLTAKWTSSKPIYTYTGNSQLIDDGNGNWRIKFLTSGTLTFTNVGNGINGIDVFCVGGGGGGGGGYGPSYTGGGGGGGGYTKTSKGVTVNAGTAYSVTIGSGGTPSYAQQTAAGSGGTTSALGVSAAGGAGGYGGYYGGGVGGKGGSGGGSGGQMYNGIDAGVGGENGGNGTNASNGTSEGGKGQGSTTREFGENSGTLYSGGGGGAGATKNAAGGAGGGGNGAKEQTGSVNSTNGAANTGGGGGGNFYWNSGTGYGGSGIVVIRNHRGTEQTVLPTYTYTGNSQLIDDGNGNWRIKFLTSGTLTLTSLGIGTSKIDVFLVGGGAGGAGSGAGGGGGYTKTVKKVSVTLKSSNAIVIGAGGNADENGGSSSAFGYSVSGGKTGNFDGGDGGSGGGSGFRKQELASAGSGGSDGSNGGNGYYKGGTGQGTTTREFGEASGKLYAGGGGGGGNNYGPASVCYPGGTGGAGGGGAGGRTEGSAGETNTGGGGGGTSGVLYAGGSGIVIIRNAR